VSPLTLAATAFTALASLLGGLLVACSAAEALELLDLLRRGRRRAPAAAPAAAERPFVSLHVPICAEPPEVVARTLLALDRLDYDAYEVVVVDNNTPDEALWRPIEALCRRLGRRFRFYHVPRLAGFKAGALNFALRHTSRDAAIVGVVDCDYEIAPRYLADLVGHFGDAQVGFVQTPQNYRDWHADRLARPCYWEYWQFFAVSMMLRERRNAILMHGTMGLVRRDALVRAGGWAEWCLTEDSELGLRILAAGYRGVYEARTYGRGLIPYTYRAYKRQRRRWVIGGVQQIRRHAGLFLPRRAGPRRLTRMQKLHYLQGWLPWFRDGVIIAAMPVTLGAGAAALVGWESPLTALPLSIGLACVVLHVATRQLVICRKHLALSWRDTLGAALAVSSLTWTVGTAWLAGWIDLAHVFHRTPKHPQSEPRRMAAARGELVLGALALLLGVGITAKLGAAGLAAGVALFGYAALLLPAAVMAHVAAARATLEKNRGRQAAGARQGASGGAATTARHAARTGHSAVA